MINLKEAAEDLELASLDIYFQIDNEQKRKQFYCGIETKVQELVTDEIRFPPQLTSSLNHKEFFNVAFLGNK